VRGQYRFRGRIDQQVGLAAASIQSMKILIANVGSSSLKCQLLDMPSETVLARAHVERVGSNKAPVRWTDRLGKEHEIETPLPDAVAAIRFVLSKLTAPADGALGSLNELDAVAFKPGHAKGYTGCQYMDGPVLAGLAEYRKYICPLHNELYINAVESFRQVLPNTPMVGQFEDFFSQEWPEHARIFSVPYEWTQKYDIRRRMGHGSTHFYVNRRIAQILGKTPEELNTVQFHLGGSSSIAAVRRGKTVDGTSGFSAGWDIDGFLVTYLAAHGEGTADEIIDRITSTRPLDAISGMGYDLRDLEAAADKGHQRAQLAIDWYVYNFRRQLGHLCFLLGKVDVITFSGGTGEASPFIRRRMLEDLEEFGIVLDNARSETCIKNEGRISSDGSKILIWVVPTNEEIVLARHCVKFLEQNAR
jgi:acetate kinase